MVRVRVWARARVRVRVRVIVLELGYVLELVLVAPFQKHFVGITAVEIAACTLLSHLYSRSFVHGAVPLSYKAAYLTPLLKTPDLVPADARLYRPISNLSVSVRAARTSLVAIRLLSYLTSSCLICHRYDSCPL